MKTCLLFPGQGAQKVGMGKALAAEVPAARRVFDEADDVLGFSLSKLCFEGPEGELRLTAHTQPAILTHSVAVLAALRERGEVVFDAVAGHSLGEWSALVAAGALTLRDAVKLVHLRGKYMQEAVPPGQGAMAAIMGLSVIAVTEVCSEAAGGEICSPANFNGAGQIVIAGSAGAVERAMGLAKEKGAKRAIALQVSAPFHCALMAPAAEKLAEALAGVTPSAPRVPVVTNVDAEPHDDAEGITKRLVAQVTAPVRWEASVEKLAAMGFTRGLELGPGRVLAGLVKRIAPDLQVVSMEGPDDLGKATEHA